MSGWIAGATVVAGIGGALIGSSASGKASKAEMKAGDKALAEQQRQYNTTREDQRPYREAGYVALGQLGVGTAAGGDFNRDFSMSDFHADPGYAFRKSEGLSAVDAGAAARGGALSGSAIKGEEAFGQDLATQEYSNAYNRFNADRTTRFNRLSSLAGLGQTSLQQTDSAGQNFGNNAAEIRLQQGNAGAAGIIGSANAAAGGLQTLGNYYLNRQYQQPPVAQTGSAAGSPGYFNNDLLQSSLTRPISSVGGI